VLPEMTEKHIKEYMTALFVSLEHLHKYNVAHRDIKPGNFLYNKAENSFLLVDFGLAQVLEPQVSYNACHQQLTEYHEATRK
jgi:cell division control protein 7